MANKPNMGNPGRWLKHVDDGQIFQHTDNLAKHIKMVEITEQEAFPERFLTSKQVDRTSKLDLSTDPKIVEKIKPKKETKPALAADASRGLGKKK